MKEEVFAEIASLLGLDSADTSTPGWFPHRLTAIGNIIQNMSDGEKADLDKEVSRLQKEGYPEETRRK